MRMQMIARTTGGEIDRALLSMRGTGGPFEIAEGRQKTVSVDTINVIETAATRQTMTIAAEGATIHLRTPHPQLRVSGHIQWNDNTIATVLFDPSKRRIYLYMDDHETEPPTLDTQTLTTLTDFLMNRTTC